MKYRRMILLVLIAGLLSASSFSGVGRASPMLGEPGKAGCMVCHGDSNLVKIENNKKVTLFIDVKAIEKTPHRRVGCTSCHTNFGYELNFHEGPVKDSKRIAGLACQNCHFKEYQVYRTSIHGKKALAGDPKGALCSDCHGAHGLIHYVKKKKGSYEEFRASIRKFEVCAKCHKEKYVSYNDYYHGRAFKLGAPDAPVCWDCHSFHKVMPVKEPGSTLSKGHIVKTCGKCHKKATKDFVKYGVLVHKKGEYEEKNLLMRILKTIFPWLRRM